MERAQPNSTHLVPQVIVAAIGVGIVGVVAVALIIYLCCFKQKLNPNQRREQLHKGNSENLLRIFFLLKYFSAYLLAHALISI